MPRVRRNDFPTLQETQGGIRTLFRTLPRVAGNIAVNFFKDRFKQGGWIDTAFQRWEPRKRQDRQEKKKDSSRALMVQSGRLRRSIKVQEVSARSVTVGTDVIYAKIHNEGGEIDHPGGTAYIVKDGKAIFITNKKAESEKANGRELKRTGPHKIKIPRRQFIGKSKLLENRIVAYIERTLNSL